MRRPFNPLLADECGNSLIEMGLAAPLLAALLIGAIDISRAVSIRLELEQAAQRTIELVQSSGFQESYLSTLEDEAEAAAGVPAGSATGVAWLECDGSSTKLAYSGSCSAGQAYARYVSISIDKTFTPVFGSSYFPGSNQDGTVTVTATAGVRVQ